MSVYEVSKAAGSEDIWSEITPPESRWQDALIAVNPHIFTVLNSLQIWQCEQTILFLQSMFWWSNVAHSTWMKATFLFSGKSTQSNVKLMSFSTMSTWQTFKKNLEPKHHSLCLPNKIAGDRHLNSPKISLNNLN